jgi:uncharacterized protein (TIGR02996 family)
MTDHDALYRAILAAPDEDTPRLAFADWLDEQGGQDNAFRADFVRTHCRLAREEPWSPGWRDLNKRWQRLHGRAIDLATKNRLPWVAHLKGRVVAWDFERGLVGRVTVYSKRFVAEGSTYFEQDPVRSIKFVTLMSARGSVKPAELFACPHLGRAAKLNFEGSGLKDEPLNRLAGSGHVRGLRALGLGGRNPFSRAAVPKLLKTLPALTELDFGGNRDFGDKHAEALAGCKEFARVTVLDVGYAGLGPAGVRAIVGSKYAVGLTVLKLAPESAYDEEYSLYTAGPRPTRADGRAIARALAESKSLTRLRELDLSGRLIGDDGLAVLAGSDSLPALRVLHIPNNAVTLKGVQELAKSPLGGRLLYLGLWFNGELDEKARAARALFPGAVVSLEPDIVV